MRHPRVRPATLGTVRNFRWDAVHGAVNLDGHLDRLAASAHYFGLPMDRGDAEKEVWAACSATSQPGRVRLDLSRGGTLAVSLTALPEAPSGPCGSGWRPSGCIVVTLVFFTSAQTAIYDRMRASRPDVDDTVLYNERGEVTETTIANLVVRLDDRWWTPPLDCGLLPGVERQRLIDTGQLANAPSPSPTCTTPMASRLSTPYEGGGQLHLRTDPSPGRAAPVGLAASIGICSGCLSNVGGRSAAVAPEPLGQNRPERERSSP